MPKENLIFKDLIRLQSQFPDFLKVQIGKSKDGGYWIKILNLEGCLTQVEDIKDLFVMVNDAVYTYLDIPEEYIRDMPRYFPSEKVRKEIQKWEKGTPFPLLQRPIPFFQQGIYATPSL